MTIDLSSVMTLLGLGGYLVAGIFAFRGQWDKSSKAKREESDRLADGLISRLQQTVDQSNKTIADLSAKLDQTTKDMHIMQGRNSVLEGLFNGSENSIMAFLKQAPVLITVANDTNRLAVEGTQNITKLEATLSRFIDTLQPLLIHLEVTKQAEEAT